MQGTTVFKTLRQVPANARPVTCTEVMWRRQTRRRLALRWQARTESSVYGDCRSGQKRSVVTGEKDGEASHLFGFTDPSQGVELSCRGACCRRVGLRFEVAPSEAGVDVSRANAVDANAFLAMVNGHGLGQRNDGALAGAIACAHGLDKIAVHRGHVDDAPPGLAQVRQRVLRAEEDSAEIYRHFAVPLLDGRILDRLVDLDCGVVKEHVDLSVDPERLLDKVPDRFRTRDVGLNGEPLAVQRLDLLYCFPRAGRVDVSHHDARSLPNELQSGGASDTSARSRDDHHSILQLHHSSRALIVRQRTVPRPVEINQPSVDAFVALTH